MSPQVKSTYLSPLTSKVRKHPMDKLTWINVLLKQLEYNQEMGQDSDLREKIIENPQWYQEKLGIDSSLEVEVVQEQKNTYHIPIPYLKGNFQEEMEVPESVRSIIDFLTKAGTDTSFRNELKANPSQVLQKNFPEVTWWDTVDIIILEDTKSKCHLPIPALGEEAELSENELSMIAGGKSSATQGEANPGCLG